MLQDTLKALRYIKEHPLTVYIGEGEFMEHEVQLNPGISQEKLDSLHPGFPLPEDYLECLKAANGIYCRGDEIIHPFEEAVEYIKLYEYADGILQIGSLLGRMFVINSKELHTGKYMYVADELCWDEFISLNTDFAGFLDTLVRFNTDLYWDWIDYEKVKFYDFRRPED